MSRISSHTTIAIIAHETLIKTERQLTQAKHDLQDALLMIPVEDLQFYIEETERIDARYAAKTEWQINERRRLGKGKDALSSRCQKPDY
jgi:hypothetical protein